MQNITLLIIAAIALICLAICINYYIWMRYMRKNTAAMKQKNECLIQEAAAACELSPASEQDFSSNNVKFVDKLTNLPSRRNLTDYLQYITSRKAQGPVKYALMIVNLDFFRCVNNNLGYEIGDLILSECAYRIQSQFSKDHFIARMDGDEFGIIFEILDDSDIDRAANKILSAMKKPIIISSQEIYLSVSIGASIFPDQGSSANDIIRNAAVAVSVVKNTNRNSYKIYSPEIVKYDHNKLIMHSELQQAIKRNEFELHYQPKIDSKTSRIVGIEALIRWNHPTRGMLYPNEFIPIAEETGVIRYIDEWVLNTACSQLQKWRQEGMTNLRLAVNLSAWQLKNVHLVDTVAEVLQKTGVAPHCLELEITESVAIENMNFTQSVLAKLINMGVSISIDDFGTGYSSLGYLKHFPINFLKIDKSFIADIIDDSNTYSIVKAIIEVAHALQLKVIAEGVENQEQLDILNKLGCDEIQGFHISKPLKVEDIEKQMRLKC